jgi:hypothetical protein
MQMRQWKGNSRWGMVGTIISLGALGLSSLSFWDAHQARRLSYELSLPMLSESTDLIEPLAPGQPIHFRITITNYGHTTARRMEPFLRFEFGKAGNPFSPNFDDSDPGVAKSVASELAPGDHTTLITNSNVSLAHDHDVAAVLSGEYNFYIYGKIPFQDVLGNLHEFHFCRLVTTPVAGSDPMKVRKCDTFNYSY